MQILNRPLTIADLEDPAKRQVQIQNMKEGRIHVGQAIDMDITGDKFLIFFEWLARGANFPPVPVEWNRDPFVEYVSIMDGHFSCALYGKQFILFFDNGDKVFLHPAGEVILDPAKVKGWVFP